MAYNAGFEARGKYYPQLSQSEVKVAPRPQILPDNGVVRVRDRYEVTSYCLNKNPMSNGAAVHNGAVACPAFLPLGTKVRILSDKLIRHDFVCEDRMGLKYRNGNFIDIWVDDCDIAMDFGRNSLIVEIID